MTLLIPTIFSARFVTGLHNASLMVPLTLLSSFCGDYLLSSYAAQCSRTSKFQISSLQVNFLANNAQKINKFVL